MESNAVPALTFPHPELTPIEGVPTFSSIQHMKRQLFANASAIHSTRGNGALGHAVIVLGVPGYNALANAGLAGAPNNWIGPVHPGPQPVIPGAATQAQINQIRDQYYRDLKEITIYNMVESTLKKQVIAAVERDYICSLEDANFGFAQVTTRQLIEHLENAYGQVDQDALDANRTELELPWEPAESIEPLWKRFITCQQVATAGNDPITNATLVRVGRKILMETGQFDLDIREWDRRPAAQQTWPLFRAFFTAANKERAKKATAKDLTHRALALKRTGSGSDPRASPLTVGSNASSQGSQVDGMGYCWTHGLGNNPDHTSATCKKKGTGHQESATVSNMMGGNNTIRRARGEKSKFRELNPTLASGQSRTRTPPRTSTGSANSARLNDPNEQIAVSNDNPATQANTGNQA